MACCFSWFMGGGDSMASPSKQSKNNTPHHDSVVTSSPVTVAVTPSSSHPPLNPKLSKKSSTNFSSPFTVVSKNPSKIKNKFLEILDGVKPKDFTGGDLDISNLEDEEITSSLFLTHQDSNGFIQFLENTLSDFKSQNLHPDDPSLIKMQTMLAQELLNRSGRYQESLDLSLLVHQSHTRTLGPYHEDTLSIQLVHSYGLLSLMRHQEALSSFRNVQSIVNEAKEQDGGNTRVINEEDERVFEQLGRSALLGIAACLKMAGECEEALKILESVHYVMSKEFEQEKGREEDGGGGKSAETLSIQYSMARVLKKQGKVKEARALAQNAYRELNNCGSPRISQDDMNMIDFEHLLATLIRDDNGGNPNVAYAVLMEIFRKETRVLGVHHPMTLSTIFNFGVLFERVGRRELARRIFEEVWEKREIVLGEDHPKTGKAKERLENMKGGGKKSGSERKERPKENLI